MQPKSSLSPLFIGFIFLFGIVFTELLAILILNKGVFTYTLDDPYIHLALAKNILHGHYGINLQEYSSPSSSIIWPFILAPLSGLSYSPFILNISISFSIVFLNYKILNHIFTTNNSKINSALISGIIIFLIFSTNTISLIFMGMEHLLQVFLITVIVLGLIMEVKTGKVEFWLIAAIIIAPLVRYECLAVSTAAIIYLLSQKYYRTALFSTFLIATLLLFFSLFLIQLGLEPLPNSILEKSSIAKDQGFLHLIVENLKNIFKNPRGNLLLYSAIILLGSALFIRKFNKDRMLALTGLLAVTLHLVVGRCDGSNRYELYIWTYALLIIIYLLGYRIFQPIIERGEHKDLAKIFFILTAFAAAGCMPYLVNIVTIPLASNNIFEQQFQMHRFATEYYKKPVAVNDIGLVSYNNAYYVLDLWGLASNEALKLRFKSNNLDWMDKLAVSKNVELAMIYDSWFNEVPENWIKVGSLFLGRTRIGAASEKVSFYALNKNSYTDITKKLIEFQKILPHGVVFKFEE